MAVMENFVSDNWRFAASLVVGSLVCGLVLSVYLKEGVRKWVLNGNSIGCPLSSAGKTPMAKEDLDRDVVARWAEHDNECEHRWSDHEKLSKERWDNNRIMLRQELTHLKEAQDRTNVTVDKILDRLDKMRGSA